MDPIKNFYYPDLYIKNKLFNYILELKNVILSVQKFLDN